MAGNGDGAPEVQISVIVATHNRRELLRRCLSSLATQTVDPAHFEAIVAADGCEDDSVSLAESLPTPYTLRTLSLDKAGKSAALNAAIEVARGETCVFIDDDIVASPRLIARYTEETDGGPVLGIGEIEERPPAATDWYAEAFARGWAEHNDELSRRQPSWRDCYGANFSAPRRKLREVGGFAEDVAIAEDLDIGLRLERAGCVPTFVEGAVGIHDDQKRGTTMLEDARRQGAAHVALADRHPEAREDLLDWDAGVGRWDPRARRLALALRVPPTGLAAAGRLLPGAGRKMLWLHFVRRLAFWSGVRSAVDRSQWRAIVAGGVGASNLATTLPLVIEAISL